MGAGPGLVLRAGLDPTRAMIPRDGLFAVAWPWHYMGSWAEAPHHTVPGPMRLVIRVTWTMTRLRNERA